jgi:hypothetical protein
MNLLKSSAGTVAGRVLCASAARGITAFKSTIKMTGPAEIAAFLILREFMETSQFAMLKHRLRPAGNQNHFQF